MPKFPVIFHITVCLLLLSGCAAQPAKHQKDSWFGKDKYAHFLSTTVVSAAIARAEKNRGKHECNAALIGFSVTMTLGAAKESYDKRRRKTLYSYHDMVWNTAGSAVGSLLGSGCRP